MSDGGKGSKQRPTNKAAYDANYDAIFRNPLDLSAFIENETVKCVQCDSSVVAAIGTPHPRCINCIDADSEGGETE